MRLLFSIIASPDYFEKGLLDQKPTLEGMNTDILVQIASVMDTQSVLAKLPCINRRFYKVFSKDNV